MKFSNVLIVWFLLVLVGAGIMLAGWGLAFAFAYNVFVPWLGVVPPEYHNLAAFVSAFLFDGLGTLLVVLTLVGAGFAACALFRLIRGSRR
ncbi:MAG TPA: hypothetical protein V6D17_15950 [Candidatus Obscuribacterales bacterium]